MYSRKTYIKHITIKYEITQKTCNYDTHGVLGFAVRFSGDFIYLIYVYYSSLSFIYVKLNRICSSTLQALWTTSAAIDNIQTQFFVILTFFGLEIVWSLRHPSSSLLKCIGYRTCRLWHFNFLFNIWLRRLGMLQTMGTIYTIFCYFIFIKKIKYHQIFTKIIFKL